MTPTDREQQARAFLRKYQAEIDRNGWSDDFCVRLLVEFAADNQRATLERVYKFVTNDRFTRTTKVTVTDIEDWLRQRIKEIQP